MLPRLTDTADLARIESRLINLIGRTFLKGAQGKPGPRIQTGVKKAFRSKTYEKQVDQIINDIVLLAVNYTDLSLRGRPPARPGRPSPGLGNQGKGEAL